MSGSDKGKDGVRDRSGSDQGKDLVRDICPWCISDVIPVCA